MQVRQLPWQFCSKAWRTLEPQDAHGLGTDRLVQSPNQQKSGPAFQLSNEDEVKKTCMVVRTNQDHTGKVLVLNKCFLEENLNN